MSEYVKAHRHGAHSALRLANRCIAEAAHNAKDREALWNEAERHMNRMYDYNDVVRRWVYHERQLRARKSHAA